MRCRPNFSPVEDILASVQALIGVLPLTLGRYCKTALQGFRAFSISQVQETLRTLPVEDIFGERPSVDRSVTVNSGEILQSRFARLQGVFHIPSTVILENLAGEHHKNRYPSPCTAQH